MRGLVGLLMLMLIHQPEKKAGVTESYIGAADGRVLEGLAGFVGAKVINAIGVSIHIGRVALGAEFARRIYRCGCSLTQVSVVLNEGLCVIELVPASEPIVFIPPAPLVASRSA